MSKVKYKIYASLFIIFLLIVFLGCERSLKEESVLLFENISFRNIPGVTEEEIKAIEELQRQNKSFTYAMAVSTEAYVNENGETSGFSVLFCEWLTDLFGIDFNVQIIDLQRLLELLLSEVEGIDFWGDFKATEERERIFYMTDPIAMRWLKSIRIKDSKPLGEIEKSRPLRYAFLQYNVAIDEVAAVIDPGSYEATLLSVAEFDDVYQLLKNGDIDAFIIVNPAEASFDSYDDIIIEDFKPLIFSAVSMTAKNPELEPVISIVNKAIKNGNKNYLAQLYNIGYKEYLASRLVLQLSEEEREYIKNRDPIKMGVQSYTYPMCFYNASKGEWQGIIFDVLEEISSLTGLSFVVGNDIDTSWNDMYMLLKNGDVAFTPHLVRIPDREYNFMWAQTPVIKDRYVLISKNDFPDLKVNEIQNIKTGLVKDFAHTAMFNAWFPNHLYTVEYQDFEEALTALENGEVDIMMGSVHQLLSLTNYRERSGYKANFLFNYTFDVTPAFNMDESVLLSIFEKALQTIDLERLSEQWQHRTFDYQTKMIQERFSWIIVAVIVLVIVFAILIFLYFRDRKKSKTIARQTVILENIHEQAMIMLNTTPLCCQLWNSNLEKIDCNEELIKLFGFK
ncbi:MAG: transporter substrate-binding domain-containing protein, partial [Treponema sp.]|nr:transporter substrate-binding domain-containing protein [Treponema sp.]